MGSKRTLGGNQIDSGKEIHRQTLGKEGKRGTNTISLERGQTLSLEHAGQYLRRQIFILFFIRIYFVYITYNDKAPSTYPP